MRVLDPAEPWPWFRTEQLTFVVEPAMMVVGFAVWLWTTKSGCAALTVICWYSMVFLVGHDPGSC